MEPETSMTANRTKLRAILRAFSIPVATVAKACGVSRPYVARVVSERDVFAGSPTFWSALERALGKLVEARQAQIFAVPPQPAEAIERLASGGQ